MIKDIADFHNAVVNQEEKIASFEIFADHLIQSGHFAAEDIDRKKKELLERWEKLKRAEERVGKELLAAETRKEEGKRFEEDVRDLNLWLDEVERLLTNEEVGDDLTAVQNMMEEHQLV